MANILVIHGPNLNLLGTREPDLYGTTTLEAINQTLGKEAAALGHQLTAYQSNSEGDLVTCIQKAPKDNIQFILINPGALTHTSISLRDAFLGVKIPFIEVHLSNVFQREPFRHHSYLSDIAQGIIMGCGAYGYSLALLAAHRTINPLS